MRRSQNHPEWEKPHLLSVTTNESGNRVTLHVDLAGITMLIDELENLREQIEADDCPHTHLFSWVPGRSQLTKTKLADQAAEAVIVDEVKIYGWNEQWALRHGLKPTSTASDP